MSNKQDKFKALLDSLVLRYKTWDETKIRDLLKCKFGNYDPSKEKDYREYLSRVEIEEYSKTAEEIERRKQLKIEQYGVEVCPICGADVIPNLGWYEEVTHRPGWRCVKGGMAHYLQYRANNVRRYQKLPIVFEEQYPIQENANEQT